MSDREDRQLARRQAARREKQKIQRLKRRRRRVLSGLVCVLILLVTVPYMLVVAIRGQILIHPEGTETVVQTPVEHTDVPDGTGVVAASSWTYTTDEAMPSGNIVDVTGAFYTYDMVRRDLFFLQKRYSDIMRVEVFGHSLDNRELLDCVIGSPNAKKDVVIQYAMHGREYIVVNLAMGQLENLLKNYESGSFKSQSLSAIFEDVRLHVIPMMNPDGVMISQQGFDAIEDESLRKGLMDIYSTDKAINKASEVLSEYTSTWKANARAVDLNRNFATDGWTTEMGTQQPSCSRYPGTAPNSEPEVQALINLTDSINCVAQIAYHVHGRIIYDDYGMQTKDPGLYERCKKLAECISAETANGDLPAYEIVSTVQDDQNPGGCSDYYMQIRKIPSVTIECGKKFKDDGSFNDAPLSLDQVQGIYEENDTVLQAIAHFYANES